MTLLEEIEAYMERTGISGHALSRSAGCGSSLIYNMREGMQPKPSTVAKLRAFLDGMKHVPSNRINRQPDRFKTSLTYVDRRNCFNCGTRSDIGCEHFPKETAQ